MTHLDAAACLVDALPGRRFVTDLPTLTVGHIAYPARLPAVPSAPAAAIG